MSLLLVPYRKEERGKASGEEGQLSDKRHKHRKEKKDPHPTRMPFCELPSGGGGVAGSKSQKIILNTWSCWWGEEQGSKWTQL